MNVKRIKIVGNNMFQELDIFAQDVMLDYVLIVLSLIINNFNPFFKRLKYYKILRLKILLYKYFNKCLKINTLFIY